MISGAKLRAVLFCLVGAGFLTGGFAQKVDVSSIPFNDLLTAQDRATLSEGEVLAKSIDKAKNISLSNANSGATAIIEATKAYAPNYLAEMVQVRPVNGNEDLLDKMAAVLTDIEHYAGIPYWSVQHQRYWDLYEKASVRDTSTSEASGGTVQTFCANLYMEPFGDIDSLITLTKTDDYLLYINENAKALKLKGINAIKKHGMKSAILVFKDGDNWILYGLGGCKTLKVAGFQKRIETSLINRIKTFVNYVFSKME